MTFSFHHLKVDYPNGDKWTKADFDFLQLKDIMSTWQKGMYDGGGWNAIFWCNHDQPRIVSRFGNDTMYRKESAKKMLATSLHMLQGTPYIYQGEEIGMTNPGFNSIDDYRDVETLNIYKLKREQGMSHEDIMAAIQQKNPETIHVRQCSGMLLKTRASHQERLGLQQLPITRILMQKKRSRTLIPFLHYYKKSSLNFESNTML
ncbi:hypothetical protein GCM10020331_022150 [Ectobacillus funiculus]